MNYSDKILIILHQQQPEKFQKLINSNPTLNQRANMLGLIKTESNNSNVLQIDWKNILKIGGFIGGGILALDKSNKAIANSNRRDDALEEFQNQDLFFLDRLSLKEWFYNHDFYVFVKEGDSIKPQEKKPFFERKLKQEEGKK